ncbi:ACT domain-containing protein, partial [Klebsiella pneumoniae]|uniref:ACT domain-containing protein n=1 Tax=Klebsiella pneumoniae TaxID=573 RepID=UPI003F79B069
VIGINYRIFKALAENGISVFLVSQASSENSTSIGVRNEDAALACDVLNAEFAKEIEMGELGQVTAECNLATVAIVGENMKHTPGIAGKSLIIFYKSNELFLFTLRLQATDNYSYCQ